MNLKRVVITGIGAISSLGKNAPELWQNITNGVSGAAKITRFDATKFNTQFACEVKNYKEEDFFDRKELRTLDLYAQFAVIAAREAIKDSGIEKGKINPERAGVISAAGIGGLDTLIEAYDCYIQDPGKPRFSPFFIPKMISNIASGLISIENGFQGINYCTVSACASSATAIADAFNYIRWGKADLFVAGGSEATVNSLGVGGFNALKALSTRNDDPQTASRPFDADREGFVVGEGGAILILEEYEHAKARGAKIYAEIVGSGMNADAYHITAPQPDGLGAARCMELAIEEAGINKSEVDYVNVHGTSTPLGDIAELKAVKKCFGEENIYNLNISSTKSMTGHLLGAAGSLEAIITTLAVQNNIVPPTINQFNRDPEIDAKLNLTPNVKQERVINYAISNTFGFGGHNCSILIKKFN